MCCENQFPPFIFFFFPPSLPFSAVHPPGSDLVMTAFHADVKQAQLLKNREKSFLCCYLKDSTKQFLLCLLVTCTTQTRLAGNAYLKDALSIQPYVLKNFQNRPWYYFFVDLLCTLIQVYTLPITFRFL